MQKINSKTQIFSTFHLVTAALMVALSVALAPLNIYIPMLGVSALRFSITDIPVFLSGALLGPLTGGIVGALSDILCYQIGPISVYYPGFTLNKMIIGVVPGIIFHYLYNKRFMEKRKLKVINMNLLIFGVLGSLFYLNVVARKDLNALHTICGLPVRIVLSVGTLLAALLFMGAVYKMNQLFEGKEGIYQLQNVILAVCINYMIVQLILTPIWLYNMTELPIALSVIVRIFKSLVDIPLHTIICYGILQAIPMKVRQRI